MTNRGHLEQLDNNLFTEQMFHLVTNYSRGYTQSRLGIAQWLNQEYNNLDWAWLVNNSNYVERNRDDR